MGLYLSAEFDTVGHMTRSGKLFPPSFMDTNTFFWFSLDAPHPPYTALPKANS